MVRTRYRYLSDTYAGHIYSRVIPETVCSNNIASDAFVFITSAFLFVAQILVVPTSLVPISVAFESFVFVLLQPASIGSICTQPFSLHPRMSGLIWRGLCLQLLNETKLANASNWTIQMRHDNHLQS